MSKLIISKSKDKIMLTTDLGGATQIITNTIFEKEYDGDIEKLKAEFRIKWKVE